MKDFSLAPYCLSFISIVLLILNVPHLFDNDSTLLLGVCVIEDHQESPQEGRGNRNFKWTSGLIFTSAIRITVTMNKKRLTQADK